MYSNNNIRKMISKSHKDSEAEQSKRPVLSYPGIPQYPIYTSGKKLQSRIEKYFDDYIKDTKMRTSIAGLAWFLGFNSTQQFDSYLDHPPTKAIGDVLKKALLKIEEVTVTDAIKNNPGAMFYSKAKFNYIEKQVIQVDAPIQLTKEQEEAYKEVASAWATVRRKQLGTKVKQLHSQDRIV